MASTSAQNRMRLEGNGLDYDVVVVGAGLAGIAFTRFYLETRRSCRLVVLEEDDAIGGVWSSTRVFDGFWVQSALRQSYFSDTELHLPTDASTHCDTFPAKFITQYLERYVRSHLYNGISIKERIWCDAKVQAAEKVGGGWKLQVTSKRSNATKIVQCTKLILANGITSLPMMPGAFLDPGCPVEALHHRNFGAAAAQILSSNSKYKEVTVIGGGKSAADMVYTTAKADKKVNWLVRLSGGEGPGIFLNPVADYPYRNVVEEGNTQNAVALNPSAFKSPGWYARLYHQCDKGLALLQNRLLSVDQRCKAGANYPKRPGALPSFKDLEPEASYFWQTGPVGVTQQIDFWEIISQRVNIFRGNISEIKEGCICLRDGRTLPTDIALCGTGWSPRCPFLTSQQVRELGLPHDYPAEDHTQAWDPLMKAADRVILQDYPILRESAQISQRSFCMPLTPARLYRGIAPLSDDSVVFLGRVRIANSFRGAEAQAIWATAYLDGNLSLPSLEARRRDIAHHTMFSRRRYPTRGGDGLNVHAGLIWYTDTLVHEAGLSSHRKDWWSDWNAPILASDLKDCRDEYVQKYGLA